MSFGNERKIKYIFNSFRYKTEEDINKELEELILRLEKDMALKETIKIIAEEYGIDEYKTGVVRVDSIEKNASPVIMIYFENQKIMRNILINRAPKEIDWVAGWKGDEGAQEYLSFKTKDECIRIEWQGYTVSQWGGLFSKIKDSGFWENEMYGYKRITSSPASNSGKYIREMTTS